VREGNGHIGIRCNRQFGWVESNIESLNRNSVSITVNRSGFIGSRRSSSFVLWLATQLDREEVGAATEWQGIPAIFGLNPRASGRNNQRVAGNDKRCIESGCRLVGPEQRTIFNVVRAYHAIQTA